MENKDHPVTLTSREQQLLADLERATSQSDPHLDAWLRTAKRSWIRLSPTSQLIVAAVGFLAAMVLMVATFTRWAWLAALAVGVQAAALGLAVRGWRQRRQH